MDTVLDMVVHEPVIGVVGRRHGQDLALEVAEIGRRRGFPPRDQNKGQGNKGPGEVEKRLALGVRARQGNRSSPRIGPVPRPGQTETETRRKGDAEHLPSLAR
jgi:hypothetical protein